MGREVKLVGFVLLLIVIFVGARAAGSHLGPVTTGHSQVERSGCLGGAGSMGGMGMGGSGSGGSRGPRRRRGCGALSRERH